ncbi:uncharacterized protein LOC125431915 isoform X3 [Sphaerodactylus townsendi]|uniref:uncharacterized protein LOC125431915 isoform X3 n=1 Tax=Sphaerodactylus townsendi TaxID=933632 RepID=UPI002026644C|nr:uncharacterized protein LOC125431915 isoform X3 [Sphaerodactylus townsendi]
MFRMAPKSLGLWMLFLWIQKGVSVDCGNYTGILGEDTDLKCCYHGGDLKSDPFRVQWQLKGNVDCVVDAYLPDQPAPPQCEHYKNRTVLNKDCLHLQLLNLSLEDSKIYECILQKKVQNKYQKVFQGQIELKVAESYMYRGFHTILACITKAKVPPGSCVAKRGTQCVSMATGSMPALPPAEICSRGRNHNIPCYCHNLE